MNTSKAKLDLLAVGHKLDWHGNRDGQKSGWLESIRISKQGDITTSGLNGCDYQSLGNLTSDPLHSFKQLRTVSKSANPDEVAEQLKQSNCRHKMGLFPEIGRAWLAIESKIYLWTYDGAMDVTHYDELTHKIECVCLVRPKKGVFVESVKYLLLLATSMEVTVLGVTFGEENSQLTETGLPENNECPQMKLMESPVFVLSNHNVPITAMQGSRDGRIFLAGRDGCLYEFHYQSSFCWIGGKRGKIINLSQSIVTHWVSSFVRMFADVDPITRIAIDNSRSLLYTLTENSDIEAWDLGEDYTKVRRIGKINEYCIVCQAVHAIRCRFIHATIFRSIKAICPLSIEDAKNLNLLAITQSGARLYFSTTSLDGQKQTRGLYLLHVRLPPGYTRNATTTKPKKVYAALYKGGTTVLLSSEKQQLLWSVSATTFTGFPYYVESTELETLEGVTWDLATYQDPCQAAHNSFLRNMRRPSKLVLLTKEGTQIIELLKSTDMLEQLLLTSGGPQHKAVQMYFRTQTEREACASALLLATSDEHGGRAIARWATEAFLVYGGEPCLPMTPMGRPQNIIVLFSAKHDGLYLYISRLLRPIWQLNCVDDELCSTLSPNDCSQLLEELKSLRTFLVILSAIDVNGQSTNSYMSLKIMANNHIVAEKALLEEMRSLSALNQFIRHTSEVIALWKLLLEHRFQTLCRQLSCDQQAILQSCTFRDLLLTRSEVYTFLIISLVDHYFKDSTSLSEVSIGLREVCPNLYRHEDVVIHRATETLMRAKVCTNAVEKDHKLRIALQMYKDAAPFLPLHSICEEFIVAGFYEGVVELVVICAAESDPDELGIQYYNNDECSKQSKGYDHYCKRMSYYKEVELMLDHIKSINQPQDKNEEHFFDCSSSLNVSVAKESSVTNIISLVLPFKDPLLHVTLYEWMLSQDMTEELLAISEQTLGVYLCHKLSRNPESLSLIELLWKYYEKNGQHMRAAQILGKLAICHQNISLEVRIEYLKLAIICMQNEKVCCTKKTEIFLKELENKYDIARLQLSILNTLLLKAQTNQAATIAVNKLNHQLYNVEQLNRQFAIPFHLVDCQAALFYYTHQNDSKLMDTVWPSMDSK
ncbi:nuclear pore complex protein Nup154-like [Scaptodrosophila lebanonensis]|uniref:Nuclear pore complex protein Nup154-like n=1 Tax=Drosophila lebanonensis TaxID=7225 RepID=A0A6J2TGF6_DROLE|nr:nuclear pore complex protein Nup154-like [Scaptodrosophila lebanonensis]XP_030374097.1 nuclear pore complex protein Nup154-like [Scaptodrosophila lebanonensis]XP_030374098.1 nuclear pore complex protein Nup154-like [Scaptodrosophila lebanonensis]